MTSQDEALSVERIQMARETLTAAFGVGVGAIGQEDPAGVYVEAKHNLTALIQHLHGQQAWIAVLDKD